MSSFTPVYRTEAPAEFTNPGLVLAFGQTPNGWKITYALQALKEAGAIPGYTVVPVFLQRDEQFTQWFIKSNPNSTFSMLDDFDLR
jgi:glutathione S-transferase